MSTGVAAARLSFQIAASQTDGFLGQIAMFRRSLDELGEPYRSADVVATIGAAEDARVADRWSRHLAGVTVRWADPAELRARGIFAQIDSRWLNVPSNRDVVFFVDADTLLLLRVDEVVELLMVDPGVAGCIAHYPFQNPEEADPLSTWQTLSGALLGHEIETRYQHTLLNGTLREAAWTACPFYLNFGFVGVSADLLPRLAVAYRLLVPVVLARIDRPFFAGQIALALAIDGVGARQHEIDMRYNFPNDERAEALYPDLLRDVRVVHYLRTAQFDRQAIFASSADFDGFLSLQLTGAAAQFQKRIRHLTDGVYPFN